MTHGTVRSYAVQLEGKSQTRLRDIRVDEELRPRVGARVKIADFPNEVFIVTRTEPPGAPTGQTFTYIVEYESDWDIIAGGDRRSFPEHYLRTLKKGGGSLYRFLKK